MAIALYALEDLLKGYVRGRPTSYIRSMDFRKLTKFMANGGPLATSRAVAQAQARHDADIGWALREHIAKTKPQMVAVMGGHGLGRDSPAYLTTADIARGLTQRGYVVVTGGGPGSMEAAHFGAYFANATEAVYRKAKTVLAEAPALPNNLDQLFDPKTGALQTNRTDLMALAATWQDAALAARDLLTDAAPGQSIAMPTWVYASEPTNVFATCYAKYYQDSVREETLVAEGKTGTLYAQGSGGTLRELFQGVEYNYYITDPAQFQPMIFADPGDYWRMDPTYGPDGRPTRSGINLVPVVKPMLKLPLSRQMLTSDPSQTWWRDCEPQILFSTDVDEIDRVLKIHAPMAQSRLTAILEGEIPAFPMKR